MESGVASAEGGTTSPVSAKDRCTGRKPQHMDTQRENQAITEAKAAEVTMPNIETRDGEDGVEVMLIKQSKHRKKAATPMTQTSSLRLQSTYYVEWTIA